jgi:hypothetical protein
MIDWTKPVCTKHDTPRIAEVLGDCPANGKKRAAFFPPSMGTPTNEPRTVVFRYYEDGHTRGDGRPSDNDLINYDPEDGAVRLDFCGRKVVCVAKAA